MHLAASLAECKDLKVRKELRDLVGSASEIQPVPLSYHLGSGLNLVRTVPGMAALA